MNPTCPRRQASFCGTRNAGQVLAARYAVWPAKRLYPRVETGMKKPVFICRNAPVLSSVKSLLLIVLARLVLSAPCAAESISLVEELRRRVAEREAEILVLKAQLADAQAQALPGQTIRQGVPLATTPPAPRRAESTQAEDDALVRALESSLVRQSGSVLRPGAWELEPEISYFYDEPTGNRRRDNFGLALTGRAGLPGAVQVELRIPYVVSDRWAGVGSSSGLGDIRLALTKELLAATERAPSLLAFAQWRSRTGDINRNPPTGYGQQALQFGLSTVKRQDPVVLFGSLSYTANVGDAHLRNGARFNAGNVFGGRVGAYLAATSEMSFFAGVAINSNDVDRFNSRPVDGSSHLSSVLELGSTTVIGRGRFLNITAGIGVTSAAPKFSLTVSLPYRF